LKEQLEPKDPKQKIIKNVPAKWKEEMLELIKDAPSIKKLLKQTRDQNQAETQVIELQAECHS
jgi:hypothetical protein